MAASFRQAGLKIILILFCAYYIGIVPGVDLIHEHGFDGEFHEDCPACQLHMTYSGTFCDYDCLDDLLRDPYASWGINVFSGAMESPSSDHFSLRLSRAPPF